MVEEFMNLNSHTKEIPFKLSQFNFEHVCVEFKLEGTETEEETSSKLYNYYLLLMKKISWETSPSYNILITRRSMFIVQRKCENFVLEETKEISLNSVCFAGSLLLKENVSNALDKYFPLDILSGVCTSNL